MTGSMLREIVRCAGLTSSPAYTHSNIHRVPQYRELVLNNLLLVAGETNRGQSISHIYSSPPTIQKRDMHRYTRTGVTDSSHLDAWTPAIVRSTYVTSRLFW